MVSQQLSQTLAQADKLQKAKSKQRKTYLIFSKYDDVHKSLTFCRLGAHVLLRAALEMLQAMAHLTAHFTIISNASAFDISTPITFSLLYRGNLIYISNRSLVTFRQ